MTAYEISNLVASILSLIAAIYSIQYVYNKYINLTPYLKKKVYQGELKQYKPQSSEPESYEPKLSIITPVFNQRDSIEICIQNVLSQKYENIEHIIIDYGSTDGTVEIIEKYQDRIAKFTSEPDTGIYHAMNKGLKMATGNIIGFLHADDMYAHSMVIDWVVSRIINCNSDSCYGDVLYVMRNHDEKVIRYWKSCPYSDGLFQRGWMPPHPTFFVRREVFDKYGYFNTDFKIDAYYELMLRFLVKHKISTHYIPEVLVKMRIGGKSNRSLINLIIKSSEDYKAWKVNNLGGGLYTILLKNISKLPQFFKR